jgi:hypothetical protein
MATTDAPADADTVASHTLAYLRSHGRKLDLVLETLARHGERLGRLEREVGEIKSDIALLESKVLTSQTEMLTILYRLDQGAFRANEESEAPPPISTD